MAWGSGERSAAWTAAVAFLRARVRAFRERLLNIGAGRLLASLLVERESTCVGASLGPHLTPVLWPRAIPFRTWLSTGSRRVRWLLWIPVGRTLSRTSSTRAFVCFALQFSFAVLQAFVLSSRCTSAACAAIRRSWGSSSVSRPDSEMT
jgi:hypothetical protein